MLLRLVILNFNNEQIFATINDKQPFYFNRLNLTKFYNIIIK